MQMAEVARMRNALGIIGGAALAVALDVAVKLVADSIPAPRKYFFIAPIFLLGLVAVKVVADSSGKRARPPRRKASPSPGRGPHVISGSRQKIGCSRFLVGAAFVFAGLVTNYTAIALAFAGHPTRESKGIVASAGLAFTLVLYGLAVRRFIGTKVRLTFSDAGVSVKDNRGTLLLGWNDATNFRTIQVSRYRALLVADPAPSSSWYLQKWEFDQDDKFVKLCELTESGILPDAVDAALANWP
jgi:hypothetical protein